MTAHFYIGAATILFIGLSFADAICYALAKYPERRNMRLWWLPGSGIYALIRYGRN